MGKVPSATDVEEKDNIVAGLLAILIGGLGIHYFYCGKVTAGFLTILLTVLSFSIWYIITFIQGICMLTMSKQAFNDKYVLSDSTFPIF